VMPKTLLTVIKPGAPLATELDSSRVPFRCRRAHAASRRSYRDLARPSKPPDAGCLPRLGKKHLSRDISCLSRLYETPFQWVKGTGVPHRNRGCETSGTLRPALCALPGSISPDGVFSRVNRSFISCCVRHAARFSVSPELRESIEGPRQAYPQPPAINFFLT
jgi:hypothetical protein